MGDEGSQQAAQQPQAEPQGEAAGQEPDYRPPWEAERANSRKWEGRAKEASSKALDEANAQVTLQTAFGMSHLQSFLGVENVVVTSKVAKGTVYVTPVENIHVYGLDFSTLGEAGLVYESDPLGLIGVHHVPDYDRASAETYLVNGATFLPEVTDFLPAGQGFSASRCCAVPSHLHTLAHRLAGGCVPVAWNSALLTASISARKEIFHHAVPQICTISHNSQKRQATTIYTVTCCFTGGP